MSVQYGQAKQARALKECTEVKTLLKKSIKRSYGKPSKTQRNTVY